MNPDSFHLMYMFAATCGVLFIPVIVGLIAVFMEREPR
jgi:hypothetical protein